MEYTIHKLAGLAGITTRTLRYYDEIGLLKPQRVTTSGYRIYGPKEVDRLQQILFYRELEMPLEHIKEILSSPGFDPTEALCSHREKLLEKQKRIGTLLQNLELTIQTKKRGIMMNDKEKFAGFKRQMIEENEKKYGPEIRRQYGDATVNASNQKLIELPAESYAEMEDLAGLVLEQLDAAFATGTPSGALAEELVALHKKWLEFSWPEYSPQAHIGLGELYVADPRFTKYYNRGTPGKAEFLRDAIASCLGPK